MFSFDAISNFPISTGTPARPPGSRKPLKLMIWFLGTNCTHTIYDPGLSFVSLESSVPLISTFRLWREGGAGEGMFFSEITQATVMFFAFLESPERALIICPCQIDPAFPVFASQGGVLGSGWTAAENGISRKRLEH